MMNMQDKMINKENSMLEGNKVVYESRFAEYQDFDIPAKKLKDYFKSNKALKNAPLDSV